MESIVKKIIEAEEAWYQNLCWSRPMILLNQDTLALFKANPIFGATICGLRIAGTFKSDAIDFILYPETLTNDERVEREYLHQLKTTIEDLNWQVRYLKNVIEILGGDNTIPTHHDLGKRKDIRGKRYNNISKEIDKDLENLKKCFQDS